MSVLRKTALIDAFLPAFAWLTLFSFLSFSLLFTVAIFEEKKKIEKEKKKCLSTYSRTEKAVALGEKKGEAGLRQDGPGDKLDKISRRAVARKKNIFE